MDSQIFTGGTLASTGQQNTHQWIVSGREALSDLCLRGVAWIHRYSLGEHWPLLGNKIPISGL